MAELCEPTFGVNNFRKPKILRTTDATIQAVLMTIFMKPGSFPSIPELGMDGLRKYRMMRMDQIDIDEIRMQLVYQCSILREGLVSSDIDVSLATAQDGTPIILITVPVSIDEEKYNLLVGITENNGKESYDYQLVCSMLSA